MNANNNILIKTDFDSGGGRISIVQHKPIILEVIPHDEGQSGWSKVWWYFKLQGLEPGQEIIIRLVKGEPEIGGISAQAYFSYDQISWALTNIGKDVVVDGKKYFEYIHTVKNHEIYLAYDLPYVPEHASTLIEECSRFERVKPFQLCETKKKRSVQAMKMEANKKAKYGIWLQARAHAFESGASWVLHEMALWLCSNDARAIQLRNWSDIYIVPIVDVDAVVEGRTGKYQLPYDHWMNWHTEPELWPEVATIKSHLLGLKSSNMMDMFIDFHGPGAKSNPFFLTPFEQDLPFEKQRINRKTFLDILQSELMSDETKKTHSMTHILYSERTWDKVKSSSSHEWVLLHTNESCVSFTLEVNMNTPLSTRSGYRSEAIALGKAMSDYFVNNQHLK
ncbi:M14 family zinc carboxypeptidase [Membranihabitans marinus]|uniref:M14 family zinc carboxypeptidase n=1 Tax=Membranihabitans marinus TaxID=1227546 RepID=UPI001F379381|nr:M14 family zinc carboxypeptidase [Membranihabitans marinus]